MSKRPVQIRLLVAGVLLAGLAVGCTDSDDGAAGSTDAEEVQDVSFSVRAPEQIAAPPAEGNGVNMPQPAPPAPDGYVTDELLVSGTATRFDTDVTPEDGRWDAVPGDEADYRTRVIVRRPASPEDFSGTVVVEWFNVSAIEASPDWAFMSEEIAREGHAYIGVSAQVQGVEGGDTLVDVTADPDQAIAAGANTDKSGLKNIDSERYGTLAHPGDAFAYDIFSQVGRGATATSDTLLGGLEPTAVIAVGESQSAAFLTTFINAVHPLDPVYDGFLVHSRGGGVAPLDGDMAAARGGDATAWRSQGIKVRDDGDVPVLVFQTETDLTLLGSAYARQPDSDIVRTWEVAGLSHADAHFIRSIIGGPRDPSVGSLLGCADPINVGPQHEVSQAALHHLVSWVGGGEPPPAGTPLQLTDDDETTIDRDTDGIALGGVRHPLVDAPTAVLSGDPPEGTTIEDVTADAGICVLFGSTTPLDQQSLIDRYGDAEGYIAAFTAATDEAVDAGFLLRPDADALLVEAEANRSLFG